MYTPGQLRPLLEAVSRADAVIVGGQAINLWSEVYARDEEPWRSLRPFTSRDLDALGSATALLECARLTGGQARFPEPGQRTVNTGQLTILLDGQPVEADFLSEVKGLNNQEVRQTARPVLWQGLTLRLLHPVLCVESKTINLMRIQQEPDERQDHKHLLLALANAREFFAEQTANPATHPALVRWAQRVRSLANDQLGLEAAQVHGINYQTAIPAALWQGSLGPLSEFMAAEWDAWGSEVRQKVHDLIELEAWLRQLRDRSPGQAGGTG
ncbi:MAG: hypothetical protein HS113_21810 [Verrucomicrobiales bacterium]|nr:hypothetical protein [Verrucomicrobiales bacterium]